MARAHVIDAQGLLARCDAAAQVAPMLASKATVLLVADAAEATTAPDMRILRLLIEAIIVDHGGGDVRVTAIDDSRPPDEIIRAARPRTASWPAYATIDPQLPFADWRHEIICRASLDAWT